MNITSLTLNHLGSLYFQLNCVNRHILEDIQQCTYHQSECINVLWP